MTLPLFSHLGLGSVSASLASLDCSTRPGSIVLLRLFLGVPRALASPAPDAFLLTSDARPSASPTDSVWVTCPIEVNLNGPGATSRSGHRSILCASAGEAFPPLATRLGLGAVVVGPKVAKVAFTEIDSVQAAS